MERLESYFCESDDLSSLQGDLDQINAWSQSKYLSFNTRKCKVVAISTKCNIGLVSSPPLLTLSGDSLDRVYQYKYIGVVISADINRNFALIIICSKACRSIG